MYNILITDIHKTKNLQNVHRLSASTGRVNCSLYLQQGGEEYATKRFPKPEHQITVGCLANLLGTFQRT